MQTVLLILLWVLGFILLFGLLLVVFLFGRMSLSDKLNKGWIFLNNSGRMATPKRAIKIDSVKRGALYSYGKSFIILPTKYKKIFWKGRVLIFANRENQLIASPFDKDILPTISEREALIYDVLESNVGSSAIKAIKSKKNMAINVIIAGVAFALGAILTYGFVSFQDAQKNVAPVAPITSTTDNKTEYNLEVK